MVLLMKALGVGFVWSLLLSAFAQVQYMGAFSGSFQYDIASPEDIVYDVNTVPLDIYIRTTSGFRFGYDNYVTEIFYCLDEKGNVTIPFTETITGEGTHYNYKALTYLSALSDGDHNIIVYAVGKKYPFVVDSIDFAIGYSSETPEPTPTFTSEPLPTPPRGEGIQTIQLMDFIIGVVAGAVAIAFLVLLYYFTKRK